MFTVKEFELYRAKVDGCCGMEFHHFYNYDYSNDGKPKADPFTYESLLEKLLVPKDKVDLYKIPWYIKPLVLFSGTTGQSKQEGNNPHKFAEWLKSEKESVTESPWTKNYGQEIKCYIWVVSDEFRKKLHEAYEAKYGKTDVPKPLKVAIVNHDIR
jgi:hypothetical protein